MTLPPDAADQASHDDRLALDTQYVAAYEQLRRLASLVSRRDVHQSLTPTALVHEAWLKLAHAPGFEWTSELHFRRIAARAMRQVLVEAARGGWPASAKTARPWRSSSSMTKPSTSPRQSA